MVSPRGLRNAAMGEGQTMTATSSGRAWAMGAGALAVLCGCLLLLMLGAPARMPLMNAAALAIGLVVARIGMVLIPANGRTADLLLLVAGAALPLTALMGEQAQGVPRWVVVAGITIQPGLILVPLLALGLALRPNLITATAVGLAALGTALQPDLGTAAMLLCGTAAAAFKVRSIVSLGASLMALAGAATALVRPAELPPARFVEHVVASAIAAGVGPATIALAGVVLMFLPALIVRRTAASATSAACTGVWAAGLIAALLGSYPTPVIGFGGSAIVGYLLSLALLTAAPAAAPARVPHSPVDADEGVDHASLRLA